MKLNTKVSIHNKFEIVVRDAATGEVKKRGVAHNIVLDQMWARLAARSLYFGYIAYGTGTGTLSAARTSLFNQLGYKTPTNVTLIKAVPVSSWKRKITINPEEAVGSVITEVGILYGSTSTNLVTHALIKDSEGNVISITKTALDVIDIYATVYVTFDTANDAISYIRLPDNNTLINYLIGGSTFSSTYAYAGGDGRSDATGFENGMASDSIGSISLTWTADAANKRFTTGAARFGVDVANGHIQEFMIKDICRIRIPSVGLFAGQSYTDVPVDTADGVKMSFILPSLNVNADSLVMKVGGVEVTNFVTERFITSLTSQPANVSPAEWGFYSLPSYYGVLKGKVTGDYLFGYTANSDPAYYNFMKRVGYGLVKLTIPEIVTGNILNGSYKDSDISDDAVYLVNMNYQYAPYLMAWKRTGDVLNRLQINNIIQPPNYASFVRVSNTGKYIVIDGVGEHIYKNDGNDVFDFMPVADFIDGACPNPTYMVFSHNDDYAAFYPNNYTVPIYKRTGEKYFLLTTLNVFVADDAAVRRLLFNHSHTMFVVTTNKGPYVFDIDGDNYTLRFNPTTIGITTDCYGVSFNEDDSLLTLCMYNTTTIKIIDMINNVEVPTSITGGMTPTMAGVMNDGRIFLAPYMSTPSRIYSAMFDTTKRETRVIFDAPPANGNAITANYTVDGIHKTNQYVVDVTLTVQLAELT